MRIVFLDVAYRQYDFKSELISIRTALESLSKYIDMSVMDLDDYLLNYGLIVNLENSNKLHNSLISYGSDKGASNNFPMLYSSIIDNLTARVPSIKILEVGLGTNNVDIESNMGTFGNPGASVRAFRDYVRSTDQIFGADIDERILFSEPRIKTMHVDQLNIKSLVNIADTLGEIDLIIDDGLHILESNLNTVFALLPNIRIGGFYVVEDIANHPENIISWHLLSNNLKKQGFTSEIVHITGSIIFVMKREK